MAAPARPRTPRARSSSAANPLAALEAAASSLLARPLTRSEVHQFSKYLETLLKWQHVTRLVGSDEPAWIVERLFIDSLLFLRVLPPVLESILDIGSGAGIPGIPLKVVRPATRLTMIESRRRRASFLSNAVRELGLSDVAVVNARAEDVLANLAGTFSAVVLRCAGRLEDVLPLALDFVAPGGLVVATGPPSSPPLSVGEWVEVSGATLGTTRKFAVARR